MSACTPEGNSACNNSSDKNNSEDPLSVLGTSARTVGLRRNVGVGSCDAKRVSDGERVVLGQLRAIVETERQAGAKRKRLLGVRNATKAFPPFGVAITTRSKYAQEVSTGDPDSKCVKDGGEEASDEEEAGNRSDSENNVEPDQGACDGGDTKVGDSLTCISRELERRSAMAALTSTKGREQAASVQSSSPQPNIDENHCGYPAILLVPEYAKDIYDYYRAVEPRFRVSPTYCETVQTDITHRMRAILVDWLVDVHLKFKLMPETLFLTVNIVDRYLSRQRATKRTLQLVGITAMHIASKYEEVWCPEIREYCYICDNSHNRAEILEMERSILLSLGFYLTVPTTHTFLSRFLKAAEVLMDKQIAHLSSFYAELGLVDYFMLEYAPSQIAAASVCLALKTANLERPPKEQLDSYPTALSVHSGYELRELRTCMQALLNLKRKYKTGNLTAVHRKYSRGTYLEVSSLLSPRR